MWPRTTPSARFSKAIVARNRSTAYHAELENLQTFECGRLRVAWGTARIAFRITRAQLGFNFTLTHSGGHNLRAGVSEQCQDFVRFIAALRHCLYEQKLTLAAQLYFGCDVYSLKCLFHDERWRIVAQIRDSTLADIDKLYGEVYEYHTALIGLVRELSMPLPAIVRVSSEFVVRRAIRRCLTRPELDFERLLHLIKTAGAYSIALDDSAKLPSPVA